jgi:aerobic-type carbon monoxide dehydrogenase small subunit (CoxS/CutS family)
MKPRPNRPGDEAAAAADPSPDESTRPDADEGVSRRGFLRGLGTGLAATALTGGVLTARSGEAEAAAAPGEPAAVSGKAPVTLTVNGKKRSASVDPRRTLLDMLRNDFDLTGAKKVCDQGSCGACTVLLDGRTVYACMTLALDADGKKVETVESLARGDHLHPLQAAFIEHDALQCGFCTPGFLMSSKALLDKNKRPTLDDVKNACSGNLCRCGTYPHIFTAVLDAAKKEA